LFSEPLPRLFETVTSTKHRQSLHSKLYHLLSGQGSCFNSCKDLG